MMRKEEALGGWGGEMGWGNGVWVDGVGADGVRAGQRAHVSQPSL